MARKLSDIEIAEISLVSKAANKKTFLFFKSDRGRTLMKGSKMNIKKTELSIAIESNGTAPGTTVKINGDNMGKLRDFNFSFYNTDKDSPVSCSYSKVVESDDGFSRTETFYLSKGDAMDKNLIALLKDYFGDEFKEEHFEKAEAPTDENLSVVKSAMKTLNKYEGDLPEDLHKAVGVIVKQAAMSTIEKQETSVDNKSDDTKSDDKSADAVSKSIAKKVVEAVQKALLPETKKSESNSDDSGFKADIEKLTKAVQSLDKADNKDAEDGKVSAVVDAVKKLTERIETVEKAHGTKKSVDGQDDSDSDDGEILWPSLQPKKE